MDNAARVRGRTLAAFVAVIVRFLGGVGFQASAMSKWSPSSGHDSAILLGAILFVVAAAVVACVWPARRIASFDPVAALRYE
jgi:ABC-type antimicrobial peptide transport system permease subunit